MFTFTVRPDGGDEYEATATSRDVVMWEKTGKGRSLSRLSEDPHMSDLYSLAHIAVRRLGLFHDSLPEFEKTVDLDLQGEESDPFPKDR